MSLLAGTAGAAALDKVELDVGVIAGTSAASGSVRVFKGIPFAAPPVGARRWQPPAPVVPWDGVLDASEWPAHCMQGPMFGPLVTRDDAMSEDCLYLNVWTPAVSKDDRLPVLFVIHGGGFAAGSASEPRTDGQWFASQGIVVVEANYRLGVFGFLAHPELSAESGGKGSGNYGLLDQAAALDWVHANIGAFGGDAGNITINGESAGSMSVSALMASPRTRGLVARAIGQSGGFFPSPSGNAALGSLAEKEQSGLAFARSVGASSLAELRARPAQELLDAVMKDGGGWGYWPVVDGYFLPEPVSEIYAAGEQASIPLLAGWTSSELGMSVSFNPEKPTATSFAAELAKQFGVQADDAALLYPAGDEDQVLRSAADLASDLFISYSTWKWVEAHAATGDAPVYRYRFDRVLPGDPAGQFGAPHASDIEYAFNTLESKKADWQDGDRAAASVMAAAFANFIRTGDPNGAGVPEWPAFGKTGQVMYIDAQSKAGAEQLRARYELIDEVMRARSGE